MNIRDPLMSCEKTLVGNFRIGCEYNTHCCQLKKEKVFNGIKGKKVKEFLLESLLDISNLLPKTLLGGKVTVIRNTHHEYYIVCVGRWRSKV